MSILKENINELVGKFEINLPPEKLEDPKTSIKIRMVCECLAVPKRVSGRRERIKDIAEHYGYNIGTAYRLMNRVRNGTELVKGTKNYGITLDGLGITLRAWDKEAAEMAVQEIMENRCEHQERLSIYTRIEEKAKKEGWKIGGYRAFLNIYNCIGRDVITYRDKGIRGLREDIIPAIRRDPTAYRPMEILVGDQHKADYYAFDSNGDVANLELFCWLDFRTQLMWGAIAYKHYNRYTVGQALLNAVKWGLPSTVYTDWGKPEISNYMNMLINQLSGLGVRTEGIRKVRAKVKNAQAKPIEARFGGMDAKLRNKRLPGYCKRLRDTRENDLQQDRLKRQIKNRELLSIPELVEEVFTVIDEWNNHQFKNRREDTGLSPLDLYNRETLTHPVTTLTDDVLDYIFLPFQECAIKRSQVKIKHEWLKTLHYYNPELSSYGGETATVRYSPFNPNAVWVFIGKQLICQAEEWGMINPKIQDHVIHKIEQQNRLAKIIRERYVKYCPQNKTIPRIGPHDREAKQVKKVRALRTKKIPFIDGMNRAEVRGKGKPSQLRELYNINSNKKDLPRTIKESLFGLSLYD